MSNFLIPRERFERLLVEVPELQAFHQGIGFDLDTLASRSTARVMVRKAFPFELPPETQVSSGEVAFFFVSLRTLDPIYRLMFSVPKDQLHSRASFLRLTVLGTVLAVANRAASAIEFTKVDQISAIL